MLYQLSYPRTHTRFYPAQDLLAPGIFNNTEPTGGAMSALWGKAVKKTGGVVASK
jgi:hypothetical protein